MTAALREQVPRLLDCLAHGKDIGLQAECGVGKSTIILQELVECPDITGTIAVVQPRRLPTRRVAERVQSMTTEHVCWKTGNGGEGPEDARLQFMTPVIFIKRCLKRDAFFPDLSVVVVDEVHERACDQDIVCAMVRGYLQKTRPHVRLVLLSNHISKAFQATWDTEQETLELIDLSGFREQSLTITYAACYFYIKKTP